VEAVIDKDRVSALLAAQLGAQRYIILTGVAKVAIDFGKPTQVWVDRMTATEARRHLAEGQFPPGSMGPKIESALSFLDGGGQEVLITTPEDLKHGDPATLGTRIVRD
jgi:carbamate kinase